MKKRVIFAFLFIAGISLSLVAQKKHRSDSLLRLIKSGGSDTSRILWLNLLSRNYSEKDPDSAMKLCLEAMEIAKKTRNGSMTRGSKKGFAICYQQLAELQLASDNEKEGLTNAQKAIKLWKEVEPPFGGGSGASINAALGGFYKIKGEKEKALRYMEFSAKCFESCGDTLGYAMTLGNISNIYHVWGDIDIARKYILKVVPIFDRLGDREKKAMCLISLSQICKDKGNYSEALEKALESLQIFEKLQNKKRIAWSYQTICSIYHLLGNFDKALEYCKKAMDLNTELKNKSSLIGNLINMGSLYTNMGEFDTALRYEDRALKLMGDKGNPGPKASLLCNMGVIYSQKNDPVLAMEYYNQALEIVNITKDKKLRSNLYGNIAEIYVTQKKYAKAEEIIKKALQIDTLADFRDHAASMYRSLSDVLFTMSRYKESLLYYENYSNCRDTVYSHQKHEEITRAEMTYEFEKKEAYEKALQEKRDAVNAAEIKQQNVVFKWVFGVLILISLFASLILISLNKARKQKKLIETKNKETEAQKKIIESKNKDILDSIHYAKRIQTSLQPSEKFMEKNLTRLHLK